MDSGDLSAERFGSRDFISLSPRVFHVRRTFPAVDKYVVYNISGPLDNPLPSVGELVTVKCN